MSTHRSYSDYIELIVSQVFFLNLIMERKTLWFDNIVVDIKGEAGILASYSELSGEDVEENNFISIDTFLPNDLFERILAFLPIASIFRAGAVCKKWNSIVHSRRFSKNLSSVLSRKPWYFMFTSGSPDSYKPMRDANGYDLIGYAYDPMVQKWYRFELPCHGTSICFIASSCGLVCFMDNDTRSQLYVCNPIPKISEKFEIPRYLIFSDYNALAISVDRSSQSYTIAMVMSKRAPHDFGQWILSIHIYCSKAKMWVSPVTETLMGCRGGDDCVICDGVLYFLSYIITELDLSGKPDGLLTYNLSSQSFSCMLINRLIPVPCPLTCGRLMNLKNKLVLVGGIGEQDQPSIIKGIGVWVLKGRDWEVFALMPSMYFQGLGNFDKVFASSGFDDLIYIQSYEAPSLLMFDMKMKKWKWSKKCPVSKRLPLQCFTGFCFEPRLELLPLGMATGQVFCGDPGPHCCP